MLLLDTCTLIWLAGDRTGLSAAALELIGENRGSLFVSAISAFEIGIKSRKGALRLLKPPDAWFSTAVAFHGLIELPVDGQTAARSTMLPPLHADPCDRMIVATAQLNGLTVLTPDLLIHRYPDTPTAW